MLDFQPMYHISVYTYIFYKYIHIHQYKAASFVSLLYMNTTGERRCTSLAAAHRPPLTTTMNPNGGYHSKSSTARTSVPLSNELALKTISSPTDPFEIHMIYFVRIDWYEYYKRLSFLYPRWTGNSLQSELQSFTLWQLSVFQLCGNHSRMHRKYHKNLWSAWSTLHPLAQTYLFVTGVGTSHDRTIALWDRSTWSSELFLRSNHATVPTGLAKSD